MATAYPKRLVCIVTGANTGIGKEAARRFVLSNRYAKVILACRNEEKGNQALLEIEPDSVLEARAAEAAAAEAGEQTESERESIKEARDKVRRGEVVGLDLASLKSVATFAERIKKRCKDQGLSLALLVNNAGRADFYGPRAETADGLEATWGVNHVGHFLLTLSLLPLLQASAGRVVTVSSSLHDPSRRGGSSKDAHPTGLGDLSDLNQKKGLGPGGKFDGQLAYRNSKLCNILFTYELHRRFGGYDGAPRFMAVSPGFIPSSDLSRHAGIFGNFFLKSVLDGVLKWIGLVKFTRTIEEGAHCYYLAATEDEVESGKYYSLTTTEDGVQGSELKWEASSKESYDEKTAAALWTTTEETIAAILGAGAVPSNEARNKGKIAQCNL